MRTLSRRVLYSILGVFGCLVIYLLFLSFPEPAFSHSVTHFGITFYSRYKLRPDVATIAHEIRARLSLSQLYDPTVKHRIFVTDSQWLYTFLNGPYRLAMARNVELRNSILVPRLVAERRAIEHFDGRQAGAVNILAHEITHTYIQRRIGLLALWRLPWWKKEGYAEYIASRGMADSEAPPAYQEAGRAWKKLLEECHFTFDQIISSDLPPPATILARRGCE